MTNKVITKKKNLNEKVDIVLIDFDGVISRNSVLNNFKIAHQFISQYIPIPFDALFNFLKSTTAFSMQDTLDFLLKSLGINISESKQKLIIKDLHRNNTTIKVEDDFYRFLDFCEGNEIRYLIFSSAEKSIKRIPEFINRIGIKNFYNLKGRSKADYNIYSNVAKELKIDLKKSIFIDDTPLALQVGKLHGITTVMMLNDVFNLNDYQIFSSFIDYKVNSFTEVGVIFNELFIRR